MRLGEAAKAVGVALAILLLNLAFTTLAIVIYAQAISPGHPAAFYQAAAPGIAAWTAPIGGAAMFILAVAALGRRRLDRNPWAFVDYRSHHLRHPPRGYRWVQVDNNYMLAAVATGLIAQIVAQR